MNRRTTRTTTAYAAAAITAVLTLGLTACGGSSNAGDPPPSPSTSPTTPSSAPTSSTPPKPKTPQDKAKAALLKYLSISEKAQQTGNLKLDTSKLPKVAVGDAFFNVVDNQQTDSDHGIRLKGDVGHNLSAPAMPNAGTVNFTDCQDWSNAKVVDKTGHEIETTDSKGNKVNVPDRYKVDYTVNLVPDRTTKKAWKVTTFNVHTKFQTC